MNWLDSTRSDRDNIWNAYFLESKKDRDLKFKHNFHSSLQFVQLKFRMDLKFKSSTIYISLIVWKLCVFRQHNNFGYFSTCFLIIILYWKGILMVALGRSSLDLSDKILFKIEIKYIFFIYKINFYVKNKIFWFIFSK